MVERLLPPSRAVGGRSLAGGQLAPLSASFAGLRVFVADLLILQRRKGYSRRRGRRFARLHGFVRASSCAWISFSHAVRQADVEPGRQNTNLSLARPANARDCSVDAPISSKLSTRNISPKPGISLSSSGRIASGVESRPVKPVPPVTRMPCTPG